MGKALLVGGFSDGTGTFGGANGPGYTMTLGDIGGYVSEGNAQHIMRAAGVLSNLGTSVDNRGTARSVQVRKNGANGNLIVSLTDTTQQVVYDNTHSDTFASGDLYCTVTNWANGPFTQPFECAVWQSTSGHQVPVATSAYIPTSGITTGYQSLVGAGGNVTAGGNTQGGTEANNQARMRTAGTVRNLQFHVAQAKTSGTAQVCTVRKNGSATSLTVTGPNNSTGIFEDTTHSDTFADGDLMSVQVANQNFLQSSFSWVSATIDYAAAENEVGAQIFASLSFNASDRFFPIGGVVTPITTEALNKLKHQFGGSCRRLRAFMISNSFSSTLTIKLRKNGADGNQTVSITSGSTGWFEDTTNTDSFSASDDINYVMRGGSAGGGASMSNVLITEQATGFAFTATNLTVGSPVFGTPAYSRNGYDFIASFPPHNPEIGTPDFTQKHVLSAVGFSVGRPFIQIPGLTGFNALSLTIGSPEFGTPTLTHPWGKYDPIPTLSQQVKEAEDLLDRVLDALLMTVPNRVGGGRPAWDFRRQVGDIRRDGQRLIVDGTLGAAFTEVFTSATAAGATLESFEKLRRKVIAETPKYVPAQATAHLATYATLAQMTAITAKSSYVSRDQALAALNRISQAFEPAEEDAADESDPAIYRALVTARAAAVRDLAERGRQLPRVIKFKFAGPMPALWIANRIYGDGGRADQLREENRWIHPAFAPEDGVCLSR